MGMKWSWREWMIMDRESWFWVVNVKLKWMLLRMRNTNLWKTERQYAAPSHCFFKRIITSFNLNSLLSISKILPFLFSFTISGLYWSYPLSKTSILLTKTFSSQFLRLFWTNPLEKKTFFFSIFSCHNCLLLKANNYKKIHWSNNFYLVVLFCRKFIFIFYH